MKQLLKNYSLFLSGLAGAILIGYIEGKIVMGIWDNSELDGKFGRLLNYLDFLQKLYLGTLLIIIIVLIGLLKLRKHPTVIFRKNIILLLLFYSIVFGIVGVAWYSKL